MRILAIRGKNLASLAEVFEITLNAGALENVGLFAITGQTGAGKSTILDALCLALYDKIPRLPDGHGFAVGHKDEDENLRVTSNDVRSILRRGTSHAFAEVDFIGKDKHVYRARWEVSKARGKADGRLQAQEVNLSNLASGQRIGQGKKSTLEAITDLIGLSFEQFRRSVLLAQGDFAAFLKAKKDERSSLLERITGTDIYSELSIAAFERARQEKEALNQISSRIQEQIPLDETARLTLEQLRDQTLSQLAELDTQIASNQSIIAWHQELKKRQTAEQLARESLITSQQAWDAAETERQLLQKVEAAQPLRPLLAHFHSANAEHQDAQTQWQSSGELKTASEITLQNAKTQADNCALSLMQAEAQHQAAQPLLIAARALDTRIDIMQQSVNTLNAEATALKLTLNQATQDHQALLNQHAEQTTILQQLNEWLAQNQAIQTIASEWKRWEAELDRYQTLHTRTADTEQQSKKLRQTITQTEPQLTALKRAIDSNEQQLAQHQDTLSQLNNEEGQHSLEEILRSKELLEHQRAQTNLALTLANTAQTLQESIQQDTDTLATTGQTLENDTQQLQTLNHQQTVNTIALGEAKKALELIQASTHKNAKQFRALLRDQQPCPVCGALEHPWQDQATISNAHAAAQATRVTELENLHETLIKTIAELTNRIDHGQTQQSALTEKLRTAQSQLAKCHNNWANLVLENLFKADINQNAYPPLPVGEGRGEGSVKQDAHFTITDPQILPVLQHQAEQINSTLVTIKQQEQTALALQKQRKAAQASLDTAKQYKEKLSEQFATLDNQHTKNNTELEHLTTTLQELANQQTQILDVLSAPFQAIDNWQQQLQTSTIAFKQDYADKVKQCQLTGQQIETATLALANLSQKEQLARQTLTQCQQQQQSKQDSLKIQTEALQSLITERAKVLPIANITADSYEQSLLLNLQTAKTAQQQAADNVKHAETELASHCQQQQHWQTETTRRYGNLQKAQNELTEGLAKQTITLAELSDLLEKECDWLARQKTAMSLLERELQESAALVKVKTDDCLKHASQPAEISAAEASLALQELQQQRETVHSHKEEQIILLREDDKKIATGHLLRAELDQQTDRWENWESLNELIGSKSGAKFRTFAQSLTLEALLAHSNQHLEDFAKRYTLQRVPGSDLELQIIDRDMADDVRSVHSLSGGESFLVSLALALGLASLSSNKTQVESLFIDEGFGSLDPETLDIAIASLDTLQALGRKVGVISHVPILVERIGAKVVVEKLGGGRSRVVIVGG
jgi:exonuclease SbcC